MTTPSGGKHATTHRLPAFRPSAPFSSHPTMHPPSLILPLSNPRLEILLRILKYFSLFLFVINARSLPLAWHGNPLHTIKPKHQAHFSQLASFVPSSLSVSDTTASAYVSSSSPVKKRNWQLGIGSKSCYMSG